MCVARDPVAEYYARDYARRARVFGRINFGDLVKNSPIRQIKIPAKVSGYTVITVYCVPTNVSAVLAARHRRNGKSLR